MHDIFNDLKSIDYKNNDQFFNISSRILYNLATSNIDVLRELIKTLPEKPELLEKCETLLLLHKLVLFEKHGFRLRFHVFREAIEDLPHNHRFSFTALILKGGYRHYIYGSEEELLVSKEKRLTPLIIRDERAGDIYTIDRRTVHSVVAQPGTVSMVIRGPAVTETALITDPVTGDRRRHHGAATADKVISERDAMDMGRMQLIVDELSNFSPDISTRNDLKLSMGYKGLANN